MLNLGSVQLYSTLASDVLLNEKGEVISTQRGGPGMFIQKVFEEEGVKCAYNYGELTKVEILVTENGEYGRLANKPAKQQISYDPTAWRVVSTLLDEWDLIEYGNQKSVLPVFVDIQGFVRDGEDFGKKKIWYDLRSFAHTIFCLKGTREEMEYVPQDLLELQKTRLLLITDGDRGVEVFSNNQHEYVSVTKIDGLPNTIGAGDTFFAYFIAEYSKSSEVIQSVKRAVNQTALFLSNKTSIYLTK